MKRLMTLIGFFAVVTVPYANEFEVRGIHFSAPSSGQVSMCADFIREELPKYKLTHLVLEVNYRYAYDSHPELKEPGELSKDDLVELADACEDAGIELVPMINCMGHQSWEKHTSALLRVYPEFDATPGLYPDNEGIYCRSYCTLIPEVHQIMFDLMDELCAVTGAKNFHVGLDEVFLLGEGDSPCAEGYTNAELFAHEVNALYYHLREKGIGMWMWGDRFLDGEITGIGKWEASGNNTEDAIDLVPRDLLICDWHYEKAHPTAVYFALEGFDVVSSPWRKPEVALGQLEMMKRAKTNSSGKVAERMKGMLHTTWCGFANFIRAYHEEDGFKNEAALETVECFKVLFMEMNDE